MIGGNILLNKKLMIITLLIISLFAVSAVCAEDNSTFDVASAENQSEDLISESDIDLVSKDDATSEVSQEVLCEKQDDENLSVNDKDVISENDESTQEKESPLYGIVDIGSNTMVLDIYKIKNSGKPKSLVSLSEKSVTAIYVENNNLTKKGIDELVSVLKDFNDAMDLANVKTKYVFATASLRKIGNAEEVIAVVKKKVGLDIHLLSGEKEANASFNSIKYELTTDSGIVIDLGGGSCEVIDFANNTKITSESMPIGSSSCYKEYVGGLFPNETEVNDIKNRVLSELNKLVVNNTVERQDLYGIGGSVKSIKKVLRYLEYIDEDADYIPVSMLDVLFDEFSQPTKETYEKILNVNAEKINTFIPGLIITKTIAEYFNVTYLHFCKNGVKEGILSEIIANESNGIDVKQNVSLNVTDIDIAADENAEILISLPNNATGTITVKLGDFSYVASLSNGSCMIVLPKLQPGNYSSKITYSGDGNYASIKTKISIHVKLASLDAHDMVRAQNSDYDYQIKLVDEEGNGISNKLVSFNVMSNQYYAITDSDGIANFKANLNEGTYAVQVSSDIAGNAESELKIVKRIGKNNDLNVFYSSNAKYKVQIFGDDGNPEKQGQNVKVWIDNKMQSLKTDKNGFITIAIDKNFKVGKHVIKISYKGITAKNNVVVKHLLTLKSASVKKSAKKLVLTASLVKVNGKYLKNKQITFKFNGKTYKSKTNSKGIAKVTIKSSVLKKLKSGKKVTYQATYLKDAVKKTAKIKK